VDGSTHRPIFCFIYVSLDTGNKRAHQALVGHLCESGKPCGHLLVSNSLEIASIFPTTNWRGIGANILVSPRRKSRPQWQRSATTLKPYRKSFALRNGAKRDETMAAFHSAAESLYCISIAGSTGRDSRTFETDCTIHFRKGILDYRVCGNAFCLCRQFVGRGETFQNCKAKIIDTALVRSTMEKIDVH
jgi:hypothetical protein